MKDLIIKGAFESVSKPSGHPGLRTVRIVYLDDQPNSNGYGVKYEDFPQIMDTIVGTPLKMRFMGAGVAGHAGSIPVGHITSAMEAEVDGVHQIIIDGILYADDYPDEVDWLEAQLEESKKDPSKTPGVSFEMSYHESILENGVNWIKGLVARAATFVRTPAYGNRTALLALAADKTISADDFMTELSALVNDNSPKIPDKGGNNMTEEEIKALQDQLKALQASLDEKTEELKARNEEIETLKAENTTLTDDLTAKATALAEYQAKEVIETRKSALAEAGITFEIKPERYAKMADEDFEAYVEDLKAAVDSAKKTAKEDDKKLLASASQRVMRLPKLEVNEDEKVSVSDLAGRLKTYSRSRTSEEDTE